MQYTANFSDKDKMIMNYEKNGIPETESIIYNMTAVLEELQKARNYFNIPFIITSGWRSKERNAKIGGAKNSDHITGCAVDFTIKGNIFVVYKWIVENLDFEQVIYEADNKGNVWIHFAKKMFDNRKEALIATWHKSLGKMEYHRYVGDKK